MAHPLQALLAVGQTFLVTCTTCAWRAPCATVPGAEILADYHRDNHHSTHVVTITIAE